MINSLTNLVTVTERLRIRLVQESDLKHIYPIHSDLEVNQFLPYDTWLDWSDAERWFALVQQRQQRNEALQFILETNSSHSLVGTCIVFDYDQSQHSIEVGYVLGQQAWKKGYMFEALISFLPALKEFVANVESKNITSLALLNKLGFLVTDQTEEDQVMLLRLEKTFT